MSLFDEKYRVGAIEGDRLVTRGILSGDVLTIVNPEPETPLTPEDYPLRKVDRPDRSVHCTSELRGSAPAVWQALWKIRLGLSVADRGMSDQF